MLNSGTKFSQHETHGNVRVRNWYKLKIIILSISVFVSQTENKISEKKSWKNDDSFSKCSVENVIIQMVCDNVDYYLLHTANLTSSKEKRKWERRL